MSAGSPKTPLLSIAKLDVERRFGMPAGRHTSAGPVLALLLGILLTVGFYAALLPLRESWLSQSFTERGWIPYVTVLFSLWALMIVLIKWRKVAVQRRVLQTSVLPDEPDFVLSPGTVDHVLGRLYDLADDPRHFILFDRIQVALANLKNMGRIGDVEDVLRSQAENDEGAMESSYTVARGLVWAIPVLGFIGTVLGLSEAIAAFTGVLNATSEMGQLKSALRSVTAGLATAFETTLQALVAALVIQMLLTMVKRREEQMLDDFRDYCQRKVVGRLRLKEWQPAEERDGAAVSI